MRNFRNWLIRKLGGIVLDDLPLSLKIYVTKEMAQNTIDKDVHHTLGHAFKIQ